jgi:hypothetical protein
LRSLRVKVEDIYLLVSTDAGNIFVLCKADGKDF